MSDPGWARALIDPEGLPPLRLRTGIVRAVSTGSTPHTASLDIGGVTVTGVTFLAGHDLEVGARVKVLQQGSELLILGPLAPARMVVAAHNHTTPPTNPTSPPAPPAAPTSPPAVRTVSVVATDSGTWQPAYSAWREDQVGQSGDGRRGFWFYGTGIATAKGTGTITAATVFLKRKLEGGVNGGANVRLGTHGQTAQPGSGSGALSNVAVLGTIGKGEGKTFALTAAQIAALNTGAAGVGLEPGAAGYTSADYLLAEPRSAGDWSGVLQLTVEG